MNPSLGCRPLIWKSVLCEYYFRKPPTTRTRQPSKRHSITHIELCGRKTPQIHRRRTCSKNRCTRFQNPEGRWQKSKSLDDKAQSGTKQTTKLFQVQTTRSNRFSSSRRRKTFAATSTCFSRFQTLCFCKFRTFLHQKNIFQLIEPK